MLFFATSGDQAGANVLADHLEGVLAMADALLEERFEPRPLTPALSADDILTELARLRTYVDRLETIELALAARLDTARAWCRRVEKADRRLSTFCRLFMGGTEGLARLLPRYADPTETQFNHETQSIAFLRRRAIIGETATSLAGIAQLEPGGDYLIAGLTPLADLVDVCESFLTGLDSFYHLYDPDELEQLAGPALGFALAPELSVDSLGPDAPGGEGMSLERDIAASAHLLPSPEIAHAPDASLSSTPPAEPVPEASVADQPAAVTLEEAAVATAAAPADAPVTTVKPAGVAERPAQTSEADSPPEVAESKIAAESSQDSASAPVSAATATPPVEASAKSDDPPDSGTVSAPSGELAAAVAAGSAADGGSGADPVPGDQPVEASGHDGPIATATSPPAASESAEASATVKEPRSEDTSGAAQGPPTAEAGAVAKTPTTTAELVRKTRLGLMQKLAQRAASLPARN